MKILLIHTGGTIGMAQTKDGFAPRHGVLEDALAQMENRKDIEARVQVSLQAVTPLIDSAQATPMDWDRVAQIVFDAQHQNDGIVVTHGTDTMAFTAGALCLALPGLSVPVVMTGAMLPLTVDGSDGWRNLKDAFNSATRAAPGVWVQFAGNLLHGGRVRKSHSSALDAFEAAPASCPPRLDGPNALVRLNEKQVGVFSVTPAPFAAMLTFAAEHCDALLLRCYGSGTVPDTPDMRRALRTAFDRHIPVIAVSQCPEGGMQLGTYAAGQILRDTGVIDGRDMTPEMAYAKLHYALSSQTTPATQRSYLGANLCGELTPL